MSKMDVAKLRMGALRTTWQQGMRSGWTPKTLQGEQNEQQEILQDKQQENWKGVQLNDGQCQQKEKSQEENTDKSSVKLSMEEEKTQEASAFSADEFSADELKKAVVMSIILGPPACRKRKRYEGNTGRR